MFFTQSAATAQQIERMNRLAQKGHIIALPRLTV